MTAPPTSESQTLITGVYRAGTEFVSMLVSGHPQLSMTMYHVNALRFCRGRYGAFTDPANLARAIDDLAARLAERYGFALGKAAVAARVAESGRRDWAGLYDAAMTTLWLSGEKRHWAEKCQLQWREIPAFIEAMPNGRAILILRDPRSVLASFRKYTYAPPPAYLGAAFNCLDSMRRAAEYRETLPPDRFMLIRYEDVARAPDDTATRIFRFLGLAPERAIHDRTSWRDAYGRPWRGNTVFQEASETFDMEASVHRWRGALSDAEIAFTEEICGGAMATFDYAPSGVSAAPDQVAALYGDDPAIASYLREFRETGEGIQAFPTDPTDSANWETPEPASA